MFRPLVISVKDENSQNTSDFYLVVLKYVIRVLQSILSTIL